MLNHVKAAHNAICDRRLGIQTVGEFRPQDSSAHGDAKRSAPLAYRLIARYIGLLELQPRDVVYDLGCGTGRPICMFARQNVARCVGVELDKRIADTARRNAAALKERRSEISIVEADAASLNYRDATVFWLYNPFGRATMAAVLARIEAGLRQSPRQVRFCYVTPEEEDVFAACGWLSRYKTQRPLLYRSGFASFWRSGAV
jgi:SAM-dependent methyltransferase